MPETGKEFHAAVDQALEAVMFESWLRFYFIVEQPASGPAADATPESGHEPGDGPGHEPAQESAGETLVIQVPEKGMERIRALYPRLAPLAEGMNGHPVDFETSRRAVCTFVLEHLDGKTMPRDMASVVFGSVLFQAGLQLFHTWLQAHEPQLDQGFSEFGAWRTLFAQWRATPGARELEAQLLGAGGGETRPQ